jgi:hypothetical protein
VRNLFVETEVDFGASNFALKLDGVVTTAKLWDWLEDVLPYVCRQPAQLLRAQASCRAQAVWRTSVGCGRACARRRAVEPEVLGTNSLIGNGLRFRQLRVEPEACAYHGRVIPCAPQDSHRPLAQRSAF